MAADVEIVGTVCWGHSTSVTQDNIRTFAANWTGTGTISGSGDSESAVLDDAEYLESEVVDSGVGTRTIALNNYNSGDTCVIKYRTGASVSACQAASWSTYSGSFESTGYVQVRIENT